MYDWAYDGKLSPHGDVSLWEAYRFFHPPLWPGAPPVERGAGPNSGPDWRESVGWKILLPLPPLTLPVLALPAPVSSAERPR
jgi:hypothetical protein